MKKPVYGFTALALAVLLSACSVTFLPEAETPPRQTRPEVVTVRPSQSVPQPVIVVPTHPRNEQIIYSCSGTRLLVRYLDSYDFAEVFYDGQWNSLPRNRSLGGEVYANNTYTWNADGRTGFLQKDGVTVVRDCRY
jgi:membrane-bound inhibitor of C-type lysozyme